MEATDNPRSTIVAESWADIGCPWCFLGTRTLDAAIDGFNRDHRETGTTVRSVFRSFELAPSLPPGTTRPITEFNVHHLGMSAEQSNAALRQVENRAAALIPNLNLAATQVANTALAHQLVHHAREHKNERAAREALYTAYFIEGRDISSIDSLTEIGSAAGLDGRQLRQALQSRRHLPAVRSDGDLARRLGIRSVPSMVLNRSTALAGARSTDAIRAALEDLVSARPDIPSS